MFKVERTIHPIGQGAFYTERLSGVFSVKSTINAIYDCGSYWDKNSRKITSKFKTHVYDFTTDSGFNNSKENLIFISHFHLDHINGVKYLLERINYADNNQLSNTKLILPLINDEMRLYYFTSNLISFYDTSRPTTQIDDELIWLWNNIYFGNSNNIQKIQISEEEQHAFFYVYKDGEFLSGNLEDYDWIYMPIVYISKDLKKISADFVSKLLTYLHLNNISELITYFSGDSLIDNWDLIVETHKNVSKPSKENNLSLMLFSGTQKHSNLDMKNLYMPNCKGLIRLDSISMKPSCLYVGDMEDPKAYNKLQNTISQSLNMAQTIGTVQISHHGGQNKFNYALSGLKTVLAFCCYGSSNTYGHPDPKTIGEFSVKKSIVFCINENDWAFRQEIQVIP